MSMTQEELASHLSENTFAVLVTQNGSLLASRSLLYAYADGDIYMMTKLVTEKRTYFQRVTATARRCHHAGFGQDLQGAVDLEVTAANHEFALC